MSQKPDEPIEPDHVEYMDMEVRTPGIGPRGHVYEAQGCPCCSGCGCLLLGFLLLAFLPLGKILSALVVVIVAGWLASLILRMAGVGRFSPIYAYLMVPLFLVIANLLIKALKGSPAYTAREIIVGTLVIYLLLWLFGARMRRWRF